MQTYVIKKQKTDKDGNKHYPEVGTLIIREGGENGVLFLNMMDGEFAVFPKEPKERPAADSGARGNEARADTPPLPRPAFTKASSRK